LFSGDRGQWVFDRFLIISCDNPIPKEKQDNDLVNKLLAEKEAIVSVAVRHLQKAITRGHLTESAKVVETTQLKTILSHCFCKKNVSCILEEQAAVFSMAFIRNGVRKTIWL
jgi:phage/plasmid-associated DNA primase